MSRHFVYNYGMERFEEENGGLFVLYSDHAAIIKELLDFIGNDYLTWNAPKLNRIAKLRKEYKDE